MIFATVSNREPRDLDRGLLDVRFLDGVQAYNYFRRNNSEPCEMVECPSYFEAYKHVLEGLKEIDDLAMEEFIVKGLFVQAFFVQITETVKLFYAFLLVTHDVMSFINQWDKTYNSLEIYANGNMLSVHVDPWS